MDSQTKRQHVLDAMDEGKAQRIQAIDLRGKTIIADHFVICSGTSDVHMRSVAERVQERLLEHGERALRVEGLPTAAWILLDYGDVVVHVMREEQRAYYDIETFWQNAPLLESMREERESS
jgi:ribosome-associated protein